jgi:very-short-patch-repair endonuclease
MRESPSDLTVIPATFYSSANLTVKCDGQLRKTPSLRRRMRISPSVPPRQNPGSPSPSPMEPPRGPRHHVGVRGGQGRRSRRQVQSAPEPEDWRYVLRTISKTDSMIRAADREPTDLMIRAADQAIAKLADQQHGLVTRTQALRLGLSADCVDGRVRAKKFQPVQRGVYRIGPASVHEAVMAAVLSCPGSVASHRSAGFLWNVAPCPGTVDLIVCRDHGHLPGIRAHRARLNSDEVTEVEGIPVAVLSRTLVDLAPILSRREMEQTLARAERTRFPMDELLELLARFRNRPGARRLRKLLDDDGRLALTRSEAEERFLALIRKAELDPPEVNVPLAGFEVDFAWRTERIIVEVDGYECHSSRSSFEGDRQRDAKLAAQGFLVMRVTWRQLAREPEAMLVRLAQALAVAGARRAGSS